MPLHLKRVFLSALSLAALATSSAALAQDQAGADSARLARPDQAAANVDFGEIVVTATRREERLSRVPVSVSAYDQANLEKRGIRAAEDVFRVTPGVQFSRSTFGSQSSISIRGIASNAGAATTAIYLDDTPIQIGTLGFSAHNFYPIVFDVNRVEVLRGPQGTLFGASSEGGAVRFITPSPDFVRTSVYARSEVGITEGGAASYEAGAGVGTPISDSLAIRASAYYRHDGGYVDRVPLPVGLAGPGGASKNSDGIDSLALRAALAWKPTETLTLTPSIFFQKTRSDDANSYWVVTPAGQPSDRGDHRYINGNGEPEVDNDKLLLPALKVEADLGFASLISNSSYMVRDQQATSDYRLFMTSTFGGFFGPYNPLNVFATPGYFDHGVLVNKQRNFTQEVRLSSNPGESPFKWIAGLYYSKQKQFASEALDTPFFDLTTGFPGVGASQAFFGFPLEKNRFVYVDENRLRTREVAAFAEVTYKITSKLAATAGVRYSNTVVNFDLIRSSPGTGYGQDSGKQKENPINPKFSLSYQADANNMFYATAAKGFRIGGVNRPLPDNAQCRAALAQIGLNKAPTTFGSDSVWSYEVGSKNNLAGGRVRLDVSAYYIKWSQIQQSIGLQACGLTFFANLADATSKGVDFQLDLRPIDNLSVNVGIGYNNSSYDDTVLAPGSNKPLVRSNYTLGAAPWTFALASQYDFSGPMDSDAYIRADYTYTKNNRRLRALTDPTSASYDPLARLDQDTQNLDVRLGARKSGVDLSLFVKNLTNRNELIAYGRPSVGGQIFTARPVRPRTWGATTSFRL